MKKFHKIVLGIVLIMAFFGFVMNTSETPTGAVVDERPIQEIAQEMEDAGFERVANDPIQRVE